ncbi:MAG TPA: GAF domain-containing protein, partial [Candidatus Paceibacterota bacterium]|nr:GAF domain-containing protein [Candidatus Paceibacterota bacterium]
EVLFRHVRRIIPISACVFYRYNAATDDLTASYAAGENAHSFVGIHIPRGQRLTGWVAANKQTILNSDPVLDLGEVARSGKPRLRSCVSTPVIAGDRLIGVLTAYSVHEEPFAEDHRRVFEGASRQIADVLDVADQAEPKPTSAPSSATISLLTEQDLRRVFDKLARRGSVSVLYIEIPQDRSGAMPLEIQIQAVAAAIRRHLPDPELVFRYGLAGIVATLPATDDVRSSHIAVQIASSLRSAEPGSKWRGLARVTVGVAGTPQDGHTLEDILATARVRHGAATQSSIPPSVH